MGDEKVGVALGFTVQANDYEPVKVSIYKERGLLPDEDEVDLVQNIVKEVGIELRDAGKASVIAIKQIMEEIHEELSDG